MSNAFAESGPASAHEGDGIGTDSADSGIGLKRRTVIALTAAIPAASGASARPFGPALTATPAGTTMLIECPKDGVVLSVEWGSSMVARGTVICHIEADDEEHALNRVDLAHKLLELEERLLDPAHVAVRRSIVEQGASATESNAKLAASIYFEIMNQIKSGLGTSRTERDAAKIAMNRALADAAKAKTSLQLFDFNIDQARKRLTLYKLQLPTEQAFLSKKLDRLKVTAPADGTLTLLVGPNSFVKKGHTLATLTTTGSGNAP